MTKKRFYSGLAILSFLGGCYFLFSGETIVSLICLHLMIWMLITRTIVDFGMRMRRIEDYLNHYQVRKDNGLANERGVKE
jgi:hypothetical protein